MTPPYAMQLSSLQHGRREPLCMLSAPGPCLPTDQALVQPGDGSQHGGVGMSCKHEL